MEKILGKFNELIYAAFRAVYGFLFMAHGVQKIFGGLGGVQGTGQPVHDYLTVIGAAGFIELVGGALIMVGLFSSISAFIASGTMAFAYFMAHAPRGFWPILNEGERAVLYAFAFLLIAARGDGAISLGRIAGRK